MWKAENLGRWAVLLTLAAGAARPAPAWALSAPDFLDWACGGETKASAIESDLLSDCGAKKQPKAGKSACDVVKGTPFACNTGIASGPNTSTCRKTTVNITVTGSTGGYLGWTVSGSVTVSGTVESSKSVDTCTLSPILPQPGGRGGTYVVEAGTASFHAKFSAGGSGSITFLGATIFGLSFEETCEDSLEAKIYRKDTAAGCPESKEYAEPVGIGEERLDAGDVRVAPEVP